MNCCHQCAGLERLFDDRTARNDLREYHKHGPAKNTRLLLEALTRRGVQGMTLLDIGGGIGAIQHELLKAGAERVTGVDASPAYLQVARGEAERRGYGDRVTSHQGDFVALAPQLDSADIVTLDRVICCYPDVQALVSLSAAHARRFYGVIYPRGAWWIRLFRPIFNSYFWLTRNPYRFFVHASQQVDTLLAAQGFRPVFRQTDFFWQVLLFERV